MSGDFAFMFFVIVIGVGIILRAVATAAMNNPGSAVKGGLELWKFFNK